jgi:hypothetical protein
MHEPLLMFESKGNASITAFSQQVYRSRFFSESAFSIFRRISIFFAGAGSINENPGIDKTVIDAIRFCILA